MGRIWDDSSKSTKVGNASGLTWGQASQTTRTLVCTELSCQPNKGSDSNHALNTTIQQCTLWLTNLSHHSADWNRKLNPTFAKTPTRRQSCSWMHQVTQLASNLTLFCSSLEVPQPSQLWARTTGNVVESGSPQSPPLAGKVSLPPWRGGQAAMDFWQQWGCQLYLWLTLFCHHLYLPVSSRALPGCVGNMMLHSGGMAEGQVIHSFIE